MRLFLALEIPEDIKKSISKQLEPLKKEYPDIKWVPEQNYHITLFFFGDQYEQKPLVEHIENITYDTDEFHLFSSENGIFMKQNLTFYVGFLKSPPIEQLVKRLKQELGIVDDLSFFPHLTVAKYRIPSKQQYLLLKKKWLQQTEIEAEFPVTQITLLESVIEENVPTYAPQAKFPLLLREDH